MIKAKIPLSESYVAHVKRSYLLHLLEKLGLEARLEYPVFEFQVLGRFQVEEV